MGQGASKSSSPDSQHVFTSESPVRFSQEIVDALQNSSESDSTRAKDLELHIQSRVQRELSRLEAETTQRLKELSEEISSSHPSSDNKNEGSSKPPSTSPKDDLSCSSVQREIDSLRTKLSKRKLKEEIVGDKAVEKAKDEMVSCLRKNDRRPLDCWKEVEEFKKEVGRLERGFLGRVLE